MREIIKKCFCRGVILCMLVGCNASSTPQRSYKIDEPIDNKIIYVAVNAVTQKKSLSIGGEEYTPKEGNRYLVFDISMKSDKENGFDFNRVTYSSNYSSNGDYVLEKELSQMASNLSESEWSAFLSNQEKKIQLIFEGPETPENMKSETFDLEQPFVIYKEDIIIE